MKNFNLFFSGYLFTSILNLLSLNLYSHYISKADLGVYTFIQSIFLILSGFLCKWLNQGILRFSEKYKKEDIRANYLGFLLIITILISLMLVSTILIIKEFFKIVDEYIIESICLCLSLFLIDVLNTFFQAFGKSKNFVVGEILRASLKLCLPVFLYLNFKGNATLFLISICVVNIVILLLQLYLLNEKVEVLKRNKFFLLLSIKMASYGLPITIWYLCAQLLAYTDRIFINHYFNLEVVAIYSLNTTLIGFASQLVAAPLINVLNPILLNLKCSSQEEILESQIRFNKAVEFYYVVAGITTFFVLFFSLEIIEFWLGESYKLNIYSYILIVISSFFWNLGSYGNKPYEIGKKTYKMVFPIIVTVIIFMFLNWILTPILGLNGVLVSKLISNSVYPLLLFYLIKRDDSILIKFAFFTKNSFQVLLYIVIAIASLILADDYISGISLHQRILIKCTIAIFVSLFFIKIFYKASLSNYKSLSLES